MNKTITIALFGSVFVGAVILLGLTGTNPVAQAVASTSTIADNSGGILGHITMTVTDNETGDIIAYRQLDNVIVQSGSDCIGARMFGSTSGSQNCGDIAADFKFIEIGTGGGACSGQPLSTAEALGNDLVVIDDANLVKKLATTIQADAAGGSGTVVTLSVAFNPSAGSHDVNEALLSNNVAAVTGDTLANQCFTPAITITSSDTLTVEWVITIGTA